MMWECGIKEKCKYTHEKFCSLYMEKPKFKSYHVTDEEWREQREECYLQHVTLCYEEWKEKKRTFIGSIVRRFAALYDVEADYNLTADLEEGFKMVVIHHDIGKLTKEYQNGKWYRHEIVGAHIVHDILLDYFIDEPYKDLLCALLSATVYLHHEAIQMARRWLKIRSPTFDYLISKIGPLSFIFEEEGHQVFEAANEIGGLNVRYRLPGVVNGVEVIKTVGCFISRLDGMPHVNTTRLCLASMILLLNEVDNKAAERGRIWCTST